MSWWSCQRAGNGDATLEPHQFGQHFRARHTGTRCAWRRELGLSGLIALDTTTTSAHDMPGRGPRCPWPHLTSLRVTTVSLWSEPDTW